jgi:hypothetical protein
MIDVKKNLTKNRMIVIACVCISLFSILISSIVTMSYADKAVSDIRIIDREGYVYTSTVIDRDRAAELQARAFLLNYFKLCYQFDTNNIEGNLNRAIKLGDATVSGYIELHQKPNNIYQAVKGLGRIAVINEREVLGNLKFSGNSFKTSFQQVLQGTTATRYKISVTGNLEYVTPESIDNPNGFFIVNYTEVYTSIYE